MNVIDRLVGYFAPHAALRRRAARSVLAQYEAAEPSRMRKFRRERGSQNEVVQLGAAAVRAQVRHLARNHDLARRALRTLVNNIVGAAGIGIEPQRPDPGSVSHENVVELTGANGKRRASLLDAKGQAHLTALGVVANLERVLGLTGAPLPAGIAVPETAPGNQ